jgi:hypothetical protein
MLSYMGLANVDLQCDSRQRDLLSVDYLTLNCVRQSWPVLWSKFVIGRFAATVQAKCVTAETTATCLAVAPQGQ